MRVARSKALAEGRVVRRRDGILMTGPMKAKRELDALDQETELPLQAASRFRETVGPADGDEHGPGVQLLSAYYESPIPLAGQEDNVDLVTAWHADRTSAVEELWMAVKRHECDIVFNVTWETLSDRPSDGEQPGTAFRCRGTAAKRPQE